MAEQAEPEDINNQKEKPENSDETKQNEDINDEKKDSNIEMSKIQLVDKSLYKYYLTFEDWDDDWYDNEVGKFEDWYDK